MGKRFSSEHNRGDLRCSAVEQRNGLRVQSNHKQNWARPLQPQIRGGFKASFRELSEHPLFENVVKLVAAPLAACIRNQRPSLLEWEADVGEEFLLTAAVLCFMLELQMLPRSVSLPPSPSLPEHERAWLWTVFAPPGSTVTRHCTRSSS